MPQSYYLHNKGSAESINQTINKRYWRATSAILEIKSVIEDYRSQHIGGLIIGIDIWELAVIPMILNNAGTWDDVSLESSKKLNNLQNTLLRYLLKTPRTTPLPALNWDFGVLLMDYRISFKKLCLAKHILSFGEDVLAKQIFQTQIKFEFPGLAKEIKMLIQELNLPNILDIETNKKWSKLMWKKKVKLALKEKCKSELKIKIDKLDKLKKMKCIKKTFKLKIT